MRRATLTQAVLDDVQVGRRQVLEEVVEAFGPRTGQLRALPGKPPSHHLETPSLRRHPTPQPADGVSELELSPLLPLQPAVAGGRHQNHGGVL